MKKIEHLESVAHDLANRGTDAKSFAASAEHAIERRRFADARKFLDLLDAVASDIDMYRRRAIDYLAAAESEVVNDLRDEPLATLMRDAEYGDGEKRDRAQREIERRAGNGEVSK